MPFVLPTLGELRRLTRDNISAYLPGADASVPNSNLRAIAEADAGNAALLLLYLAQMAREMLPDTAEDFLDRHADIWLKQPRKAATFAVGTIRLTGLAGIVVPALTRFRAATGVEYQTTAGVTLGTGPVDVAAEALTEGTGGNLAAGATLGITVAQTGLDGVATVAIMTGGTNGESDEELRARVLDRIQSPPHGGNGNDWRSWALEVPGVTRAWIAPNEVGVGTVTVRVMLDELRADAGGLPTPDDLAAVYAHIDPVRPVTVKEWWAVSPIAQPHNLKIGNLSTATAATRAAINRELQAVYLERAEPGETFWRAWADEAISRAIGEVHHTLEATDLVPISAGHMAVLGTVQYV